MRHSVETKLLQEVLNYLGSKPFNEVSSLITKIQTDAQPIEESKVEAEPVKGE